MPGSMRPGTRTGAPPGENGDHPDWSIPLTKPKISSNSCVTFRVAHQHIIFKQIETHTVNIAHTFGYSGLCSRPIRISAQPAVVLVIKYRSFYATKNTC